MSDQAGFRIDGVLYPFPDSFTIGDSVLVKMVGGLDMEDFGELLADGAATSDPRALVGMIGVAVWRKNPRWSLERVTRFVQQIDMEKLGFEGGEEPIEDEGDAGPPSQKSTESESPSETSEEKPSPDASSPSPAGEFRSPQAGDVAQTGASKEASGSGGPVPIRSGLPPSPITSRASSPG